MHHFIYKGDDLYCEDLLVSSIAEQVGTPFYLYSHATITRHFRVFEGAFNSLEHLTCFSVKSNSNIAILKTLALEGAGADIVSGGELGLAFQQVRLSFLAWERHGMRLSLLSNQIS